MNSGLAGLSVLVTGGARGIGRITVQEFAREGAHVFVADTNEEGGSEVVATVRSSGGHATFVLADVTNADAMAAAVRFVVDMHGQLDCAVNCAAITLKDEHARRLPTAEVDTAVFDRIIAVDLRGMFLSLKFELTQMSAQGCGAVVNVSSGAGLSASKFNPSYVAAKHGVIGLTKAAALDYAEQGIRVNTVAPGVTQAPVPLKATSSDYEVARAAAGARIPMKRLAEAHEIAQAILWLCSPLSSFVTGATVVVDGGSAAR